MGLESCWRELEQIAFFAPPYKTKTLSASMKDPKSNCVYPNSSLTFLDFPQ